MNPETEFRPGLEELAAHYKDILTLLGEDAEREGLLKTPMRVAKAMQISPADISKTHTKCSPMLSSRRNTTRWSSSRTSTSSLCASIT